MIDEPESPIDTPGEIAMDRLRMALIGGGGAGFIGKVHATAATLDRQAELVAGALSSNPEKAKSAAIPFGIAPERAYESYDALLESESRRDQHDRADFVSIATPNHTHFEIASAALRAGFHVVCDKPMTTTLKDAQELVELAESSDRVFALTHNYSGYPLMRQAREMVAAGEIGDVIAVRVSYAQGWMHGVDPTATPSRGAWKSDPEKNGPGGSLGDVGTHAFHLASFVSGLEPRTLLSQMNSYSHHHQLDDYGHAVIRYDNDATGLVTWSQVTHGRLNDLSIEVDGTRAALSWQQESPNQLFVRSLGKPTQIYERNPNAGYSSPAAIAACRLPGGHPEAFFEAFANVYRDAFADMRRVNAGQPTPLEPKLYPTVHDGMQGVRFLTRCLESHQQDSRWQTW